MNHRMDSSLSLAYIDGEWADVDGGTRFDVQDPGTGDVVGRVADTGEPEWSRALDAAASAQGEWGGTSRGERSRILRFLHDEVERRSEELAHIIGLESGKPLDEARAEVRYGSSFLLWFSQLVMTQAGSVVPSPSGDYQMQVEKVPVGPSLLITPWNFPFAMLTRKVGAALAAGCTSIVKPAALTPYTCAWFFDLLHEAGLPAGAVNYLPTTRASAFSSALMGDSRLRKVSFTGSTNVGRVLVRQSVDHFQRTSMELGGNAPFVVLPDAEFKDAMDGIMTAKFRNAGQACVAANRLLVPRDQYEDYVSEISRRAEELHVGGSEDLSTEMGPLADASQVDSMRGIIADARAEGGIVRTGGEALQGPGFYFAPTVISDLPIGGTTWSREIFGPVAAVYAYDSVESVADLANDTEYGLVSYLYGQRSADLDEVAGRLQSGMVAVNRPVISEASSPFGGVKSSGFGREGGHHGLDDYQDIRYTARREFP